MAIISIYSTRKICQGRIFIRLAKDLRLLDLKKYENLSNHIQEIGKMLGGWIKYEREKSLPKENAPQAASVATYEDHQQPL